MPGLAELALGTAPIAGGALLGLIVGNGRGPDVRAGIKADMDLLDRLPAEDTERRAALQGAIDVRIDDIVATVARNRDIRALATSYRGNWRDIVVFVCTVLFTIVWWEVDHHRAHWLPMFVALIVLSVICAGYALRGFAEGLGEFRRRRWN
ncbi:hypothetical protein MINS_21860 [Mycolicibacterium insubricum]|jgi:hypothetical protein|uniref:Uncharacterized protein n=1 Tax=Mycolicibacterium insubricum TaxID=444597 RepID=A0A1X0DJR1_9MYCO|nr:hypothetical protein [Mycolicibacterium insubricum]MCB9439830.1 hypothetical protein [Mycolicibacterium sp.]MCV7080711.1 hypothetical protein [Mycolicibacterium insubricum]ORA72547.1 hypothetical protein BST26_04625 [Mycolicibacterium insubricum]BBZ66757.1 hypothetical protein MINS_21860 [Mycolicibacterium insubricum]